MNHRFFGITLVLVKEIANSIVPAGKSINCEMNCQPKYFIITK